MEGGGGGRGKREGEGSGGEVRGHGSRDKGQGRAVWKLGGGGGYAWRRYCCRVLVKFRCPGRLSSPPSGVSKCMDP